MAQSAAPTSRKLEEFKRVEQMVEGKSKDEVEDAYDLFSGKQPKQNLHPKTAQPYSSNSEYVIEDIVFNSGVEDIDEQQSIRNQLKKLNLNEEELRDWSSEYLNIDEQFDVIDLPEPPSTPPNQSAAAAAISPFSSSIDQVDYAAYEWGGTLMKQQQNIDRMQKTLDYNTQVEADIKESELRESKKIDKLSREKNIENRIKEIDDELSSQAYMNPEMEDKANRLKIERDLLKKILKVEYNSNKKTKNVFRNIIENEVSEDDPYYEDFKNIYNDSRIEELTNELYNTNKTLLPEGWDPVDNSIEDWFLTDKEGSLLNWNSKSGRFDGIKFKQIEEIAERMNLSTEEVVESVEELESLMREKMKGEDRKQLKRDWKNHWVNKVNEAKGGMPIDLDREWTDKEKAHHHASLNEALDTENVELITYALDNAGFFNGNQFYREYWDSWVLMYMSLLAQELI